MDLKAKTDRIEDILEGRCEPLSPDEVAIDEAFMAKLKKDTAVTVRKEPKKERARSQPKLRILQLEKKSVTFDESVEDNGTSINGRSTRPVRRIRRKGTPRSKSKKAGCECGCTIF